MTILPLLLCALLLMTHICLKKKKRQTFKIESPIHERLKVEGERPTIC